MRVTSCPDDFGDYCFLEGTIDLEGSAAEIAPQPAAGQDHLVLALDCSGSMAGSPYKAVLNALLTMEKLLAGVELDVTMVFFNHQAETRKLVKGQTPHEVARRVDPRFQTNFQAALDAVRAHVHPKPHDRVRVLFMTDGMANRGDSVAGLRDFTRWACDEKDTVVSVDVMAFQTSDNIQFLDKLRCAGNVEGIYRYCTQSSGLEEMLGEIFSMIGARSTAITELALELPKSCTAIGTGATDGVPSGWPTKGEGKSVEIGLWVRFEGAVPEHAEIVANGVPISTEILRQRTYRGASNGDRASGRSPSFATYLQFVERKIFEYCQPGLISGPTAEDAQQLQGMLKACQVVFGDRRITKEERGILLEWRSDVQVRLDKLHSLIQAGARGAAAADNALISEMSSLRFDGAVKSARRQRALDQRVAANAAAAGIIDSQLQKLAARDELPTDLPTDPEEEDFYQCSLTFADMPEIMGDTIDDVIGFALCVQRPEEVVDAPSLIRVHGISTTLLTRSALLDAIKFKLDATDQLTVHGGYGIDGEVGVATVGRGREPINAWLPLYVCDSHWQRVRLLMKPTLGFFCCMDPLAFAENQYQSLLLVLGTMAMKSSSPSFGERELRLLVAFRRTCRATFEDIGWLDEKVHIVLTDFVRDPGCRLKHVVTSLIALIGGLLIADQKIADAVVEAGFWDYVEMESLRRGCGVLLKSMSDASVVELEQRLLNGGSSGRDGVGTEEAETIWQQLLHPAQKIGRPADTVAAPWEVDGEGPKPRSAPVGGPAVSKVRKLPRSIVTKLEMCGHGKLGTVPGAAAAAAEKVAYAESKCREWWTEQLEAARGHTGNSVDEDGTSFDEIELQVTSGAVKTVRELLDRVRAVTYPTPTGLQACSNLVEHLRGVPPIEDVTQPIGDFLQTIKGTITDKYPLGVVGLAWRATSGNPTAALQWLQAALIQCVANHRNKDARSTCTNKEWADSLSDTFVRDASKTIVDTLRRQRDTEADTMAMAVLIQRANQVLANVESIEAFIGLLWLAHPNGRGEYYNELLAHIADPSASVPLRQHKVEVLVTGRWKDRTVFAAGNACLPRGALKAELESVLGLDVVTTIYVSTASRECLAWAYRDIDLPNRHGHCNSKPYRKCFCGECIRRFGWQDT